MINYNDIEYTFKITLILLIVEPFTWQWFLSLGIGAFVIHFSRQIYSTFFAKTIKTTLQKIKKKLIDKNNSNDGNIKK